MRILFLLITSIYLIFPIASHAETITMVADRWCPYNCDPGSEHPGFIVEIAQKAFARHNITVEYSVIPWTRAIEETRQNKYTAIIAAARDDAPDFVFPTIPQGWMRNFFYVKKGNAWRFTGVGSLTDISLGIIADYSYSDALDAYIAKHKNELKYIQVLSGDNVLDINMKKLLANRIGAFVEGQYVVDYYLSQHGNIDKVEQAGSLPESESDNLFVAFSPNNPKSKAYADILTKEMKAMRKSGELKEILSAYNINDWQK